jgi:hypothetical protein
LRGLSEVDQAVENSDDVVDAKHKGVEDTSTAQLQTSMQVEELRESQGDHAQ